MEMKGKGKEVRSSLLRKQKHRESIMTSKAQTKNITFNQASLKTGTIFSSIKVVSQTDHSC